MENKFAVALRDDTCKNMINSALQLPEARRKFVADMMTAVSNNPRLQECEALSIVSVFLMGNSLGLSMSPTLGYAYPIPYGNKAQFQIGWKGLVQLAIRTDRYKDIGVECVRKNEYKGRDPLTRNPIIEFEEYTNVEEEIVGYVAYFRMTNGFEKRLYMSVKECQFHAKKYSKGYLSTKSTNLWKNDFDTMAQKTVLKQLLSKWGYMSAEMATATQYDQAVIKEDGTPEYIDNAASITKEIEDIEPKITRQQRNDMFALANNDGELAMSAMVECGYPKNTPSKNIKAKDYDKICEKIADKIESAEKENKE